MRREVWTIKTIRGEFLAKVIVEAEPLRDPPKVKEVKKDNG